MELQDRSCMGEYKCVRCVHNTELVDTLQATVFCSIDFIFHMWLCGQGRKEPIDFWFINRSRLLWDFIEKTYRVTTGRIFCSIYFIGHV